MAETRKILISPGWGAGWSTWNKEYRDDFIFNEDLIAAIERGDPPREGTEDDPQTTLGAFHQWLKLKHAPDDEDFYAYYGGANQLQVVEVNGPFIVEEYDGFESLRLRDDEDWL